MEVGPLKSWSSPAAGKNVSFQWGLQNMHLFGADIWSFEHEPGTCWKSGAKQTHNKTPKRLLAVPH